MLADGTDKVIWKNVAFVFVAADAAAPDGNALLAFCLWLRLWLNVVLVIGVGCGRNVA